jgi:ketosteroid isomerase-like protein
VKPAGWLRMLRRLALPILFILAGCRPNPELEIGRVLDQELQAVSQGNAADFFAAYGPGYEDAFFPLARSRDRVRARLEAAPRLSAGLLHRVIDAEGDRAVVRQEFYLEGLLAGKARRYQEEEHVRLERSAAGWKIAAGSGLYQLLAGRVEEEDRIEQVLDQRSLALEKRDLGLYLAVVSPRYSDQGRGPEAVRHKVEGIFESFQEIRYRAFNRQVRLNGDQAVVEQGFRLEAAPAGAGPGERRTFEDRERLSLTGKTAGGRSSGGFEPWMKRSACNTCWAWRAFRRTTTRKRRST